MIEVDCLREVVSAYMPAWRLERVQRGRRCLVLWVANGIRDWGKLGKLTFIGEDDGLAIGVAH